MKVMWRGDGVLELVKVWGLVCTWNHHFIVENKTAKIFDKKSKLRSDRRIGTRSGTKEKKSNNSAVPFQWKYWSGNGVVSSIVVSESIVLGEGYVVWDKIHRLWWSETVRAWSKTLRGHSKALRGWWKDEDFGWSKTLVGVFFYDCDACLMKV